jgi:hypothetical protein
MDAAVSADRAGHGVSKSYFAAATATCNPRFPVAALPLECGPLHACSCCTIRTYYSCCCCCRW